MKTMHVGLRLMCNGKKEVQDIECKCGLDAVACRRVPAKPKELGVMSNIAFPSNVAPAVDDVHAMDPADVRHDHTIATVSRLWACLAFVAQADDETELVQEGAPEELPGPALNTIRHIHAQLLGTYLYAVKREQPVPIHNAHLAVQSVANAIATPVECLARVAFLAAHVLDRTSWAISPQDLIEVTAPER